MPPVLAVNSCAIFTMSPVGRRYTAPQRQSWASSAGARSRSVATNTRTHSSAAATAPSTAASTPTFANTREPAATTPPASTAATSPTAIGLVNPTPGIPERRSSSHPAAAPTTIPSDTLPASAGTSHSAGTRTRSGHADDHRTPTARIGDARTPSRDAGRAGYGKPGQAGEPDNRRRERDNRPRQCLRASRARPSTNTRATGTAVATSRPRQPCHHNGGRARFGKYLADLGSAVFGGGGQSREAQLQQRSRQHGVREQVDGVCPGEPRQAP